MVRREMKGPTVRPGNLGLLATATLAGLLSAAACNGGDTTVTPTPTATEASTTTSVPVEPLPDPLPEPFIIRGDGEVVIEAEEEILYTVQPGDTLAVIAEQFGITAAELQRINGIADPSQLRAGDELRVPVRPGTLAERIAAESEDTGEDFAGPPDGEPYTVSPGDTLIDIAVRYGVDWQELQRHNRLSDFEAGNLQIGQVIYIPPPSDEADAEDEPPG